MFMKVHIREAKSTDIQLVKKMFVETSWNYLSEMKKESLDRERWNRNVTEYFGNALKEENNEVFIAEDEEYRYVGHLIVGQNKGMISELSFGYVYDVFVEEEFRGKGVGKLLLEKAEDYCRKSGYSRIALSVSATNTTAINLYCRTGYQPERIDMAKEIV
jgi:ribosomal protein S18 acetylase RimI-like enzyme